MIKVPLRQTISGLLPQLFVVCKYYLIVFCSQLLPLSKNGHVHSKEGRSKIETGQAIITKLKIIMFSKY